jgi:hypothetical protein
MKTLIITAVLLLCAGCSTTNISKLVQAASKDPATVHLRVSSIYGTVDYWRINPMTNSLPYNISPDGSVTMVPKP